MSRSLVGPLPSGWTSTTLGALCASGRGDIQTGPFGSQLHASDYVEAGVPTVMPQNLGDNVIVEQGIARISEQDAKRLARYRLRTGDIVYSRRGDVERRALVRSNEDGWLCGTGCLRVRVGDACDPTYLSYYLGHPAVRTWVVQHAIGATMLNLNTSILGNLPVVVPPRHVQYAVANLLSALDDKIAVLRAIIERSSVLIETSFLEAARSKDSAPTPLTSVVDFDFGLPFSSDFFASEGSGMPLVRIRDLRTFKPQVFTTQRIPGDTLVNAGDVVAGMDAEFRPTFWLGTPGLLNQRVLRARPRNVGGLSFVREALRAPLRELENQKTGTTVIHLNKADLQRTHVLVPSAERIAAFERVCEPLRKHMVAAAQESGALMTLRDTLLPRLVSGRIRVREAEKATEEVL